MPGIPAAAAATLSTPADLFSFDDDDGFGDFIFASSDQPLPPHQQQDDDDWGEFVVGPLGSQRFESPATPPPLFDAFPSHSAAVVVDEIAGVKEWEKPRGALPLSIFGEEEEEEVNEPQPLQPLDLCSPSLPSSSPATDHKGPVAGGELRDLITSLYGHAPQPVGVDRIGSRLAKGKEGDTDESSWEYKDASSSSPNSVLKSMMEDGIREEKSGPRGVAAVGEVEVIRIGSQGHQEANGWISVGSGGQDVSNGGTDGAGFLSDASFPMVVHDKIRNAQNTDDWFSSPENGEKRGEEELWKFGDKEVKRSFGSSVIMFWRTKSYQLWDKGCVSPIPLPLTSVSHEEPMIQDAETKMLGPSTETEVTRSVLKSNLVDWPVHSCSNFKKEADLGLDDLNGYFCEPMFVGSSTKDKTFTPSDRLTNNTLEMFIEVDQDDAVCTANDATKKHQNSDMVSSVQTDDHLGRTQCEFLKTSEVVVRNQDSACEIDRNDSTNLTHNSLVALYCRLKDGSASLLNCHLDDLKNAYEVASLSGEEVQEKEINEEIKVAYEKLEEVKGTENAKIGEHLSKNVCICQLLKTVEEPNFRAFEQEYHLSERIISAGKKLSAAIEFLEHTNSVLCILAFASREEQHAYIHAWSAISVACVQELQHGAMILQESVQAQKLIFQEVKYFIAIGEIYRVTEVLRVSLKLYKPWILLNRGVSSQLLTNLDKCAEAWTVSGLENALKTISDANGVEYAVLAKRLLSSIKLLGDLDLSHYSFNHDKRICRISLLTTEELQDMKMVLWSRKYYFVKLANLWANRISGDPPKLTF
ncbi:hypothetical protein C4D60_Mb08t07940 [Musa balbisiana]|uniref:Synergin gamma C-terminal domain-containing protein n=1 Tax=Musa balbisiana TaxID=52838 RepID=A0A4S8K257_MUSBA|nr:hypothetical protein C4D60_Mb08t07940 [Musa balbisiana]